MEGISMARTAGVIPRHFSADESGVVSWYVTQNGQMVHPRFL
jgi:hypothetical protein